MNERRRKMHFAETKQDEAMVSGKVLSIFFQNNSNFYKVLLIKVNDTNNINYLEDEIVITGHFGQIQEDFSYQFYGELTKHPKYGVQFLANRYQEEKPKGEDALIDYFSSDKFPGIGKVTAEKIVASLGNHAVEEIEQNPTVLDKVKGLNQKRKQTIIDVLESEAGTNKFLFFLQENGLTASIAYKIIEKYQEETITLLKENPYRMIEDIESIGFIRADRFAENIGVEANDPTRLQAGIFYAMQELSVSNGDTYAEQSNILPKAVQLLEKSRPFIIQMEMMEELMENMVEEKRLIQEKEKYFIPSLYYSEKELALIIADMISEKNKITVEVEDLDEKINQLEKELSISYGKSQKEAIKYALNSPLFILTGGPGTGKTTVIEGIVELFAKVNDWNLDEMDVNDEDFPILLTAPTGRAAKRMNETTGLPSATIHRLLGINSSEGMDEDFDRVLKGKLLVVDEMSMVDTWLANQMFKAIPSDMHVILVGDRDQLPSVGPGQVLHDLIQSNKIPAIELKEIYRQEDGSSLIPLAHHIKNNELPADFTTNKKDRSFISCNSHQVLEVISTVVEKAIKKGFTAQDIQVLAPMYRGPAGVDVLNKHLQELFNPNPSGKRKEVKFIDTVYRIGDKVIQLINDTESGIFNGDIGEITGITLAKDTADKVDELTLLFDKKEITYKRNDWKKITLAYCSSIHKAQGSEFNMVILPMVSYYGRMLRKDLLYTAITRASERLIMCGEPQAYERSITAGVQIRQTTLSERITILFDTTDSVAVLEESEKQSDKVTVQETAKVRKMVAADTHKEYVLTTENIQSGEISPMIGMESITPYP